MSKLKCLVSMSWTEQKVVECVPAGLGVGKGKFGQIWARVGKGGQV